MLGAWNRHIRTADATACNNAITWPTQHSQFVAAERTVEWLCGRSTAGEHSVQTEHTHVDEYRKILKQSW